MKEYILLLDVDGVFNVLGQTDDPIDVISCGYEKWRVKKSMLGWLYYISTKPNVKCIWLSTWQNDANVINKHYSYQRLLILLTIICGQPIIHQHLLKRNKSKLSKNNFQIIPLFQLTTT